MLLENQQRFYITAKKFFSVFMYRMKIMPVSNINYKKPTFKANNRWVCDRVGTPLFKTTTYFFRDDLDWKVLVKYLVNKYKNADKVNVLSHACSNGMEPYSFVMQLLHSASKEAEKFFPIIAKDIDGKNIRAAKAGICGASTQDQERAQRSLDYKLWDYVNWREAQNKNNDMVLSPKQFVRDKINFSEGNIFNDIGDLPDKNNIVFCRNFWLYLTPEGTDFLLQKLKSKLDETSTLILGNFDFIGNEILYKKLHDAGFYSDLKYVFSKKAKQ